MGEENSATLVEDQTPVSPTIDYKKSTKPIMEKRRRARINASLLELKALLLDVMRQEGVRHQKMEKADILEMAVKHLRQIQKGVGLSTDRFVLNKQNAGFNECANEVSRYLNDTDNVDIDIRTKILDHLMNIVQGGDNDDMTQLPGPTLSPVASVQPSPPASVSPISLPTSPLKISGNFVQAVNSLATAGQVLNNGQVAAVQPMQVIVRQGASPTVVQYTAPSTVMPSLNATPQVLGGLQLIPVQLSNGDVVFAIPKQSVQQTAPVSIPEKQPERNEPPTTDQTQVATSHLSPVPLHINTSPSVQPPPKHTQHAPSLQQHSPTIPHHGPTNHSQQQRQYSPASQQLGALNQQHNLVSRHSPVSPLSQHHMSAYQHPNPDPHHRSSLHHSQNHQQHSPSMDTVHRPTAHQSVIKHTSPKMQCIDRNNNDFNVPSNYGDDLSFKKESDSPNISKKEQWSEKQKVDLRSCQSFIEYHRKMGSLNYDYDSDLKSRDYQKKQTLSHHGLLYKTMRDSRFQPYSTQQHYSQDISQQCVWRPW